MADEQKPQQPSTVRICPNCGLPLTNPGWQRCPRCQSEVSGCDGCAACGRCAQGSQKPVG